MQAIKQNLLMCTTYTPQLENMYYIETHKDFWKSVSILQIEISFKYSLKCILKQVCMDCKNFCTKINLTFNYIFHQHSAVFFYVWGSIFSRDGEPSNEDLSRTQV